MGKKSRFKKEKNKDLSVVSDSVKESKLSRFSSLVIEYLIYIIIILIPAINWPQISLPVLKTSLLGILVLAALFFWIIKLFETRKWPLKLNFITASFAVFAAGVILSTIFSQIPEMSFWGSERMQGLRTFFFYFLFFLIFISNIRTEKQVQNIISILVWISLPFSIMGIFQYYGLSFIPLPADLKTLSGNYRAMADFGNPIFFGGWLAIVIPLAIYKIIDSWNKTSKKFTFIFVTILFLDIAALFLTFTRGAVFAFLASMFILMLIIALAKKIRWLWISSIVVAVLVIAALISLNIPSNPLGVPKNAITARFSDILSKKSTAFSRIQIWKLVSKPILEHPILGVGPDAFGPLSLSKSYYNEELMKADFDGSQKRIDRAHNIILDNMLSFGLIATLGFFAMMIYSIIFLIKLIRAPSEINNKKYFFICLLTAFFAYFIQGMAEFSESSLFILIFTLVGVTYYYIFDAKNNAEIAARDIKSKFGQGPWWVYFISAVAVTIIGWYLIYLPWSADAKCNEGKKWITSGKLRNYALGVLREAHKHMYHDEGCSVTLYKNLIDDAKSEQYPEIEKELKNAREKWPEEGFYSTMLSRLYNNWGKIDSAKYQDSNQVMEDALNYFGLQSSFYHAYIYNLAERGDFKKADEKIKEAEEKTKYMHDYYYYWAAKGALVYESLDEALKYLNMIGKSSIKSLTSYKYNTIGNIYGQKDDLDKAMEAWNKCIEVDFKNTNCMRNIAVYHLNNRQFDKAIEYADKIKEIDPNAGQKLWYEIEDIRAQEE